MQKLSNSCFIPKIVTTILGGYRLDHLRSDLVAGFTVAVVALPLAVALAIASGASPDKGLVTAIIGGFLVSLLGGSRVQIGGPTGAFVVIVFNIIAQYGFDGLILATTMAGLMMIAAGYLRLGQAIKYIPLPVVTGFTAGIAVIIATAQVREFLGLRVDSVPADFIEQWKSYLSAMNTINISAVAVGSFSVMIGMLCRTFMPHYPTYLIMLVLGSLVVEIWQLPLETVGSRFPELSLEIPLPTIPNVTIAKIQQLLPSACTIALLASVEALLSAVVADGLSGFRHRSNQELVGQGFANVASACFGGLPVTGAIARTATNIAAGGKTPLSGLFHAMFLLIFVLFGIDLIRCVPMPVLAGVLFLVAWGMSETHQFLEIMRLATSDRMVLCISFFLTIFVDLTVAIAVGISMASLLFMAQMSKSIDLIRGFKPCDRMDTMEDYRAILPPDVEIFSIEGPIFFGIAAELLDLFTMTGPFPKLLILRMSSVPYLDLTGAKALSQLIDRCQQKGTLVIFSDLKQQPESLMKGLYSKPKYEAIEYAPTLERAIALANESLTKK